MGAKDTNLYFVLGEDEAQKQARIAELKKKLLQSEDAATLDYDVLYGDKLSAADLKKTLLSLPAVNPRRVIVIHHIHKLSAALQALICEQLALAEHLALVLEGVKSPFKAKSLGGVKAQTFDYGLPEGVNVFKMTDAMKSRRPDQALKVLAELFESGNHPLQIMGGLIWFWEKYGRRLPAGGHEKGLRCLQEADINIKRSRLDPEQAMEVCVVKLTALLAG